jgi:hypothetical protein
MNEDLSVAKPLETDEHLCFSCGLPIGADDRFCRHCNMPVGILMGNDPLQSAHMDGVFYARAIDRRPKLVVVIGMWVLFFPVAVLAAFVVVALLVNFTQNGFIGALIFLIALAIAYYLSKMLFTVTRNYLKKPGVEESDPRI